MHFFDEETTGGLKNLGYTEVAIEDSWGLALQAGIDYDLSKNIFVNFNVRWVDVNTEAKIKGGAFGDISVKNIELDPIILMLTVGTVF